MHYETTLVWTSNRPFTDFYSATPGSTPSYRYEEIRREYLQERGIALPVPNPGGWTCPVHIDDDLSIVVIFFSRLGLVAFRKQLEKALVPAFVDRLEVKPAPP
jgi:hypothetical protein